MNKFASLALVAGLAMALTTFGASAAAVPGGPAPTPTPSSGSQHDPCDTMGHMRSVSAADIAAIGPAQKIVLMAVCEDGTIQTRNNYGALFVNGNVNTLRVPLARNQAIMSTLTARDYDQHDVVNLRFGANDSIILYVHQRDMR